MEIRSTRRREEPLSNDETSLPKELTNVTRRWDEIIGLVVTSYNEKDLGFQVHVGTKRDDHIELRGDETARKLNWARH